MNDSFIRKNTARAAAKVALVYGLNGAQKSMEREKAHQETVGERENSDISISAPQKERNALLQLQLFYPPPCCIL